MKNKDYDLSYCELCALSCTIQYSALLLCHLYCWRAAVAFVGNCGDREAVALLVVVGRYIAAL